MQRPNTPSGFAAASFSVLVILTILVVVQNTQSVPTTVLFRTFSIPLTLLLGLTLASGIVSGVVLYRGLSERKYRR